jgi:hypothetical protein
VRGGSVGNEIDNADGDSQRSITSTRTCGDVESCCEDVTRVGGFIVARFASQNTAQLVHSRGVVQKGA